MKYSTERPATTPAGLSAEAARWWTTLTSEYAIADAGGLLILQTALEAFDRMRRAQEAIARDGETVVDRFGQPKAHPATTVERDARAQMLQALKALNLDVEPQRDRTVR